MGPGIPVDPNVTRNLQRGRAATGLSQLAASLGALRHARGGCDRRVRSAATAADLARRDRRRVRLPRSSTQRPLVTVLSSTVEGPARAGGPRRVDGRVSGRGRHAVCPARPVRPAPGRFSLSAGAPRRDQPGATREEGHGGQAGSGRQGHRRRRAHRAASASSTATVLTEYRGLTVAQLTELRRSLGRETTYAVAKNTLAKRAATDAGIDRPRRAVHRSYRARLRLRRCRRGGEGPARVREGQPAAGHQGRRLRGQGDHGGRGQQARRPRVPRGAAGQAGRRDEGAT